MKWFVVLDDNGISDLYAKTLWPSGLRRWLKAPVRKGVNRLKLADTALAVSFRTA